MEFSFDFKSLLDPKKRLLLAVLLLAFGVACVVPLSWNPIVAREDCITLDVAFDDCKYRTLDESIDANSIYLTFQDYSTDLDIHSSCANDILTGDLMELASGTKMRLLVHEDSRKIYELEVAGETWLTYEEAIEKINQNMILATKLGYVLLAAGALFLLSAVIPLLFVARKKV